MHESWALIRLWHCEAVDLGLSPREDCPFVTRTSYITTPRRWRELSHEELSRRIEHILEATYRMCNAITEVRMVCFAYHFEWVAQHDMTAPVEAPELWELPDPLVGDVLLERAFDELMMRAAMPRRGIASRGYADAFQVWDVDAHDRWLLVRDRDRLALLDRRHRTAGTASAARR